MHPNGYKQVPTCNPLQYRSPTCIARYKLFNLKIEKFDIFCVCIQVLLDYELFHLEFF